MITLTPWSLADYTSSKLQQKLFWAFCYAEKKQRFSNH